MQIEYYRRFSAFCETVHGLTPFKELEGGKTVLKIRAVPGE